MKCDFSIDYSGTTDLPKELNAWLEETPLSAPQKTAYAQWLNSSSPELRDALQTYFSDDSLKERITPVWIYSELDNSIVTLLINQNELAPEPGECGSILAYARAFGYNADFLYSDCYGQLSCSSCAVEVLQGEPENPTPKDEEYDMLDIDLERPPSKFTRLSCQTVVGKQPLFCKIRATA